MLRYTVRVITFGILFALLAESVWWCFVPNSAVMQPLNASLAVTAAIFGIPADRLAAAAAQRRQALLALRHDLLRNRTLLTEARELAQNPSHGQVYPRLILGALDTAVLLNALSPSRDQNVLNLVLDWRGIAFDLNRRLEMTELRLCTGDLVDRAELDLLRDIAGRPDGHFARAASSLEALSSAIDLSLRRPAR